MDNIKNVIIIGASSGIGREIADIYARRGCTLHVCARSIERLESFAARYPGMVTVHPLDVDAPDAAARFAGILRTSGDVDAVINCAGIGSYNPELDCDTDIKTVRTDCLGFTAIADTAFNYLAASGRPARFAAISSIAGVRTLGMSLSYSASKRFQNAYLEGLDKLRRIRKLPVAITDIRPGFTATPLLDSSRSYPMLMKPGHVARLAVGAIDRKKRVAVIDWRYSLLVAFWRLIPRWLWVRLPIRFSI